MGASHSTLASLASAADDVAPELEGPTLGQYEMNKPLFPGSGRMMRTYLLRHKATSSTAVLKSMWISQEHDTFVDQHEKELSKLKALLVGQPHIAPFWHWSVGSYRPRGSLSVRQVSLLRPHVYTALSDRLASRPFLTNVEKLWISYQILQALDAMHAKGVVHGFLTTENIGLSSWNWVVLVDVASYKARTSLPDDDPSEYLYYFQELYKHGSDNTPREKRCYLAPERFYTPNLESGDKNDKDQTPLTPAMDMFSAGCVLMETFLNGERAFDLGDLMEYRKKGSSQTLQQKLNKIDFSALRAACRHMLNLEPSERLSASTYLERLQASELVPPSFGVLATMMERVTFASPEKRLAVAALSYSHVLKTALGIEDAEGQNYVERIIGSTTSEFDILLGYSKAPSVSEPETTHESDSTVEEKKEESNATMDLFAETEALLKKLESMTFDDQEPAEVERAAQYERTDGHSKNSSREIEVIKTSKMSQSSILIYLHLVLATVRHLQRPDSKLIALRVMASLSKYATDEDRLQRILPVTVSLLHDQDSLVRASAVSVLAATVSSVQSFPPSDSKVFPQYIFKKVAHLITDPSLLTRLAFAKNVALLAETAHRFLDISHAVRLFEAVGGGHSSGAPSRVEGSKDSTPNPSSLFAEDVARLLDDSRPPKANKRRLEATGSGIESAGSEGVTAANKTVINSNYNAELASLQETVSRWVVHITTDQSEHSSPCKRALISDMARLCTFFGLDGVMAFILPQLLSFLNDRKDWQLRASLFETLPSVCYIIGRAATEHFVFPCLEIALVDSEEAVISRALQCLTQLLRMKLLSRSIIVGSMDAGGNEGSAGYVLFLCLLQHPLSEST